MSTLISNEKETSTDSSPMREERLFLLLSIFIGIISGLVVVSFRMAIEWLTVLLQGSAPAPHQLRLVIVPAVIGLALGVMIRYVFPDVRGSGVNQTKAALYIHNGYISTKTMIGKFLLAALSIGSGQSLGPEDPSLHFGAGVASRIGRYMGLSRERMRLFAPVGAAAGLAAAFNAPISAVLLVIEEVIGQWTAAILGSIVLSAVSAVVVARWFWGPQPMFRIPPVTLRDPRELLAYAVLGVVGGFASLALTKALAYLRPRLRSQSANRQMFMPALAGLFVGGIAYFGVPQVLGVGYGAMDAAMHAQYTIGFLLLLAGLKLVASTVSFSSGAPGGLFATALFLGAMLGSVVGTVEHGLFPSLTGSVGSYALVGMGVFFAAFIRVPLTSVFMILEMSGNYSVILPVILANTIAYLISRSLQPVPILELFTHQDGLYLPSMEEEREDSQLHFEDALKPSSAPILPGGEKLNELAKTVENNSEIAHAAAVLIQCSDGWYAATQTELQQMLTNASADREGAGAKTLEQSVGQARTPLLFPDQPLANALPFFKIWPLLPISNRAIRGVIEGVLTLDDVLKRYQRS
ncbi:chloride channel protein EriC [Terriglobus roseus DSM 18391]|uniref:Chloride channel protein EriC n=1 Tax=Terriglobus roseus (strain DSM 18391 / NRRL B-41598 / KBS 63) TaxID=926566 RepID=I3ZFS9_TERRK|nr:chloride channel protein [Terriglobus roseus]AFL88097.1 chloride channel protein EriC [Terriglobus roseus DSM 18391]